jgi:hypothetical protein
MESKLTKEIEKEIIKLFGKDTLIIADFQIRRLLPRFAGEEVQETLIQLVEEKKLFYSQGDYSNYKFQEEK